MTEIHFTVAGRHPEEFEFRVKRMINAGYVGRDQEAVRRHIEELRSHGVKAPEKVPTFYPVLPNMLSTSSSFEVIGDATSGEVEYVIIWHKGKAYVGVGSDHTDRELEKVSVLKSKQICPNVVSSVLWEYEEVKPHWDNLVIRSWVGKGRSRLYQEAKLSSIMTPEQLMEYIDRLAPGDRDGLVVFSGTVPTLGEGLAFEDYFEGELEDPVLGRSISFAYEAVRINWFRGDMEKGF